MSDFEEELLALVDEPSDSRKRSKASSGSSKRRNPAPSSDDEQPMDLESEEDEPLTRANPYKLEGIYKDEADRARIMDMSELEREEVLAGRQAERAKFDEKRQLDAMFRSRQGEAPAGVAGAAKRQHQSTGTTSEKRGKLEELKRKRVEKNDRHSKKSRSGHSPSRRSASGSDDDSSESDDGRKDGKSRERQAVTRDDLQRIRISRGTLAEHAFSPHFNEFVIGGYVRYMIGLGKEKTNKYRICEIIDVETYKPYEFEGVRDDRKLKLKHGKSEKAFTMEQISNADFTQEEFDHWKAQMKADKISLPSQKELKKKKEAFAEILSRKLTDADITAMITRKSALSRPKSTESRLELNRKRTEHSLAIKRKDYDAAEKLAAEIADMEMTLSMTAPPAPKPDRADDTMAKLNEKNRKAQAEAIRKSDADNKEKRRLAALASGVRSSNTSTPGTGSPMIAASLAPSVSVPDLSLAAGGTSAKKTVEAAVVSTLDLDLGDF